MIKRHETIDEQPTVEAPPRCEPVPRRLATVIAVMEMGVSDYDLIARAVGVTVDEVKRIDKAEDGRIRSAASKGTPKGTFLPLNKAMRCPQCRQLITLVPCVACANLEN